MTDTDKTNYILDNPIFSFWQVITFVLVFAFVGSWVIKSFAATSEVKSFTATQQKSGTVLLQALISKKPADDLVVTNTCHPHNSAVSSSQTTAFSDWTLDSKSGYIGQVTFNVPAKQKCFAYIHRGNAASLAHFSYESL